MARRALSFPNGFSYHPVVSPDGRNVHAVALNDTPAEFTRNPSTGALSNPACTTDASSGCATNGATLLLSESTRASLQERPDDTSFVCELELRGAGRALRLWTVSGTEGTRTEFTQASVLGGSPQPA